MILTQGNNHNVAAGSGMDIVQVGTSGHSVKGGADVDVLRATSSAGNNITLAGDAGDDIISVAGGANHTLAGGAGNDTYIISNLVAGGRYVIEQTTAATGDRDRLSLTKFNSRDFDTELDGAGNLVMTYINGAQITIKGFEAHPLSKVVFKDTSIKGFMLVPGAVDPDAENVINISPSENVYYATAARDKFVLSEANTYASIVGATSVDSIEYSGHIEPGSRIYVEISSRDGKNLETYWTIDAFGEHEYIGHIIFVDYLVDNRSIIVNGEQYSFLFDDCKYYASEGNNNFVVINDEVTFNAVIDGANNSTYIDLSELDFSINEQGYDNPFEYTRSGNDLLLSFSGEDYQVGARSTLTIKNYYLNRPQIKMGLNEYGPDSELLVLGSGGTVDLTTLIPGDADGVCYIGTSGRDTITATKGYHYVQAGEGNDTINMNFDSAGGGIANAGAAIYAGAGDDIITVENATVDTYVYGGSGSDNISISSSIYVDTCIEAYGGAGDDVITITNTYTWDSDFEVDADGGAGNDRFVVRGGGMYWLDGDIGCNSYDIIWTRNMKTFISNYFGEGDTVTINNVAFKDLSFTLDYNGGLLIAGANSGLAQSFWDEDVDEAIYIEKWDSNNLNSINLVKNGVTKTYTFADIDAIVNTGAVNINSWDNGSYTADNGTVDKYIFGGSDWNISINNFGDEDVLNFTAYGNMPYAWCTSVDEIMYDDYYNLVAYPTDLKITVIDLNSNTNVGAITLNNYFSSNYSECKPLHIRENHYGNISVIDYSVDNCASSSSVRMLGETAVNAVFGEKYSNKSVELSSCDDIVTLNGSGMNVNLNGGNNTVYVNGSGHCINGYSGDDTYYIDWNTAKNVNISDWSYSDNDSVVITGAYANDFYFSYEDESCGILRLTDVVGNYIAFNNWHDQDSYSDSLCSYKGIQFDGGFMSVDAIEAKIEADKNYFIPDDVTVVDATTTRLVFAETGWEKQIVNFDADSMYLDFTKYFGQNYALRNYSRGNDAVIDIIDVADYSNEVVASIIVKDMLNDSESSDCYINVKYCVGSGENHYISDNSLWFYYDWDISYVNVLSDACIMNINHDYTNFYNSYAPSELIINSNSNSIYTGSVDDTIYVYADNSFVNAENGDDVIYCCGSNNQIYGAQGSDRYIFAWDPMGNNSVSDLKESYQLYDFNTIELYGENVFDLSVRYSYGSLLISDEQKTLTIEGWDLSYIDKIMLVDTNGNCDGHYAREYTTDNVNDALNNIYDYAMSFSDSRVGCTETIVEDSYYHDTLTKLNIAGNQ